MFYQKPFEISDNANSSQSPVASTASFEFENIFVTTLVGGENNNENGGNIVSSAINVNSSKTVDKTVVSDKRENGEVILSMPIDIEPQSNTTRPNRKTIGQSLTSLSVSDNSNSSCIVNLTTTKTIADTTNTGESSSCFSELETSNCSEWKPQFDHAKFYEFLTGLTEMKTYTKRLLNNLELAQQDLYDLRTKVALITGARLEVHNDEQMTKALELLKSYKEAAEDHKNVV